MQISTAEISMYGIAYADKNGKGFSKKEPWITDDYGASQEMCLDKANEMANLGYKRVIPFVYDRSKCESYTWEYVRKHRLKAN